jgi:hypothetical protein
VLNLQAIPRNTDEFNSLLDVGWYASAYQFGRYVQCLILVEQLSQQGSKKNRGIQIRPGKRNRRKGLTEVKRGTSASDWQNIYSLQHEGLLSSFRTSDRGVAKSSAK